MSDDELWESIKNSVKQIKKPPSVPKVKKKLKTPANTQESRLQENIFNLKTLEKGDIKTLDGSTAARFTKGKIRPAARLDLHGFTAAQAFISVKEFIQTQYSLHARCVLIVTGKGKTVIDENGLVSNTGILRNELPTWLNHAEVRGYIVSFVNAKDKDGGQGAFYIYLKRPKPIDKLQEYNKLTAKKKQEL